MDEFWARMWAVEFLRSCRDDQWIGLRLGDLDDSRTLLARRGSRKPINLATGGLETYGADIIVHCPVGLDLEKVMSGCRMGLVLDIRG